MESSRRPVEEIWINEPGRVFIARPGRSELTTVILTSDEGADLVERMLRLSGRGWTSARPRRLVDEVLTGYLDRAAMSALPPLGDADAAARTVFDQVAGFGPLQYFDDWAVEENSSEPRPASGEGARHLRGIAVPA